MAEDPREDILDRFFIGRRDAFAHWNGEKNQWQCTRRDIPSYLVRSHLQGKITVATYPVNTLGNVPFICFDIDSKSQEAYSLVEWLKNWFETNHILFLVEDTGGRGLHGWQLFLCFVPAIKAIALANLGLDAYKKEVGPLPCPVEIFPKQAKPKDVGNCIRLPWGKHHSGKWSRFLDSNLEPDDEAAIQAIQNGQRTTEFDLDKLLPEGAVKKVRAKKDQLVAPDERWGEVIPEGRRHNTLVSLAGELRARKFSPDRILTELLMHNQQRCRPPVDEKEVEQIAQGVVERTTEGARESQADGIVTLARGHYLFHNSLGEGFARFKNSNHSETWPILSRSYRQWLAYQFYSRHSKVPNSQAMLEAIATLSGKALFSGATHPLSLRTAWHEGCLWYDLADSKWRAIKVDRNGWQIVDEPPILFRRYNPMLEQVEPLSGGNPTKILGFLNLPDHLQCLFMVWLISAFIPDIPRPVLMPFGSFGSGKTLLFRLIKSLIDPSAIETLSFATDRAQFAQQLAHNYCCFYDNIHSLPPWVNDLLCRSVTGEGFAKRQLYTDDEDVIYQFRRVVGLDSLELIAESPDLLDRAILLELEPIRDESRKTEAEIWREFNEVKPDILGGIFDTLSLALGIMPQLSFERLPRMADWASYGQAIAEALPYGKAQFLQSYATATKHQSLEALKANLLSQTLLAYIDDYEEFTGTMANLLGVLAAKAEALNIDTKARGWPKAPNALSKTLKALRPNLQREGLMVSIEGHTKKGTSVIIKRIGSLSSPLSLSSTQIEGVEKPDREGGDDRISNTTLTSSPEKSIVTSEPDRGDDGDDKTALPFERDKLLELGAKLGYTRLEFSPGRAIAEGQAGWKQFVETATGDSVDKALAAAEAENDIRELWK